MDAMQIYNKLARPPKEALKSIGGGRLKGMTDIKPQWRIKALTENFGLCGFGWTYTIDKVWSEPGADHDVMCFAIVSVKIKDGDTWGESFPGIGGSQIVEKESKGLHTNDEGYKMAVTDALSVAFKMVGVAADIYMGNWDGTKYKDTIDDTLTLADSLLKICDAKNKNELRSAFEEAWKLFPNSHDIITTTKDECKVKFNE